MTLIGMLGLMAPSSKSSHFPRFSLLCPGPTMGRGAAVHVRGAAAVLGVLLCAPWLVVVAGGGGHTKLSHSTASDSPASSGGLDTASSYDVGAIYFGDWHPDPDMAAHHGSPNWTEFNVVLNAGPKYPGHLQPNVPLRAPGFGVGSREDTPEGMAAKVQRAQQAGIDWFLFDWYWYAEKGENGGVFLGGALENGFLKMKPNSTSDFKFAIMWANQDWVDLHPAKYGYSGTYRSSPQQTPREAHELLQFDGFLQEKPAVAAAALRYIVDTYFTRPDYKTVPTRLSNGTVAQCAYFSLYQPEILASAAGGLAGGTTLMADFRAYAASKNTCVHFAPMVTQGFARTDPYLKPWGVDSVVSYCIMKLYSLPDFPESNYTQSIEGLVAKWAAAASHFAADDIPFLPTTSVAWDSSPRTLPSDPFLESAGYPWGASIHSTPETFEAGLRVAKAYIDSHCKGKSRTQAGAAWCPPLLINAWNEWSEGAYLEPDERYQFGKLDAVKAVFGAGRRRGGVAAGAARSQHHGQ